MKWRKTMKSNGFELSSYSKAIQVEAIRIEGIEKDTANLRKESADLEAEKLREYNDIDGFGENLTPMQKARVLKYLNKKTFTKDGRESKLSNVKTELKEVFKRDWYIRPRNGEDTIMYKEGNSDYILGDVYQTKTAREYLQYLKSNGKMAMGGKVTFNDKVKAIKASLLKKKKVSPKVQKDYGKTYSPKEAEQSAKRIVGSMRKKGMK